MAKLANWLMDRVELGKDGKPYLKEDLVAKVDDKPYIIDRFKDVWLLLQMSKTDNNLITGATTIINHVGLIRLAKDCGMKLESIVPTWLQVPSIANGYHAIVECSYPGCPPVIGEANELNLNRTMKSYSATMALKRGVDRVITHYTGLYENGVYSSSELGGDFGGDSVVEETSDSKERDEIISKIGKLINRGKTSTAILTEKLNIISNGRTRFSSDATLLELQQLLKEVDV